MGQSKRKRSRFFEKNPTCVYCGGDAPANTIDHVPPVIMFALRQRPEGLEVPACEACNHGTSKHEQVAAFIGRFYPDASTDAERMEMHRLIGNISNNNPGLLEEIKPSFLQEKRFRNVELKPAGSGGVINASGPLLNNSMQIFGAKLGYALYYVRTRRIVPDNGGVAVRWFSNHQALNGELPESLFNFASGPETLEQGSWNVGEQFSYMYEIDEARRIAAFTAMFRKSFAVSAWVSENRVEFGKFDPGRIHRPGGFYPKASI